MTASWLARRERPHEAIAALRSLERDRWGQTRLINDPWISMDRSAIRPIITPSADFISPNPSLLAAEGVAKGCDPFSLRDDSRDGGGRTKFGTRVEKAGVRGYKNQSISFSDPLTLTLSRGERITTPSRGERGLLQHPPGGRGDFYNTLRREKESFLINRVNIRLNIFCIQTESVA